MDHRLLSGQHRPRRALVEHATHARRRVARRRRRRRLQVIVIYTLIAVGLAWFFESQATTTVIFVRHAEKAASPAEDPGLNEAGQRRATELARQLVDADVVPGVGVDAVYSTSFRRTVETARPVAEALDLQIMTYDAADTAAFLESLVALDSTPAEGRSDAAKDAPAKGGG